MAALFDLVKNPELAELVIAEDSDEGDDEPSPDPNSTFSVEIQRLRRRALEVDAYDMAIRINSGRDDLLDDLAQEFVQKCLEAGVAASETTQRDLPDLHDRRYQVILRVCTVPLIAGDWETVVNGREAAIAAVAELHARGYASPGHRFARDGAEWTLSITFGF